MEELRPVRNVKQASVHATENHMEERTFTVLAATSQQELGGFVVVTAAAFRAQTPVTGRGHWEDFFKRAFCANHLSPFCANRLPRAVRMRLRQMACLSKEGNETSRLDEPRQKRHDMRKRTYWLYPTWVTVPWHAVDQTY